MVFPSSLLTRRVLPGHRALLRSRHGGGVVRSARPSAVMLLDHRSSSLTSSSRREFAGLASVTSWVRDVVRTKSLAPPNPILQSLKEVEDNHNENSATTATTTTPYKLPPFARMLPYHLNGAAELVASQYNVDLAELEVKITGAYGSSASSFDVLQELDRMEAPILQVLEVGSLFSQLASQPDDMQAWNKSLLTAKAKVTPLPQKESKIIYNALLKSPDTHPSLLKAFQKSGVHLTNQQEREQLHKIHHQLAMLSDRLLQIQEFLPCPKVVRLQAVSDMYNVIGLSHQQAKLLGFPHVSALEMDSHMASLEQIEQMHQQVTAFLQPRVAQKVKLNAQVSAGSFLPQQAKGPTEEEKALWEARRSVKKLLRLNGVIQGLMDLAGGLLGIKVEEDTTDTESTWHKDVRLFHLYDQDDDDKGKDDDKNDSSSSSPHQKYLGSFYMDPYQRQDKAPQNKTRLFSRRTHQTAKPVAIMALNIAPPAWDDDPSPLSWDDTRSLLYQFGKALQLILTQATVEQGKATIPVDVSEFLPNFMELWLQNDGFVKRLGELSQDQYTFQTDIMEILRKETVNQKTDELMKHVFLGSLESTIFTNFDPRGDETLVALQGRLAEQYVPHNMPDTNDLSPLLQVFQENAVDQSMTAYSYLWSEILSANVFEKFSKTDMKDQDEVKRLGRAIRHLFLRQNDTNLTMDDFEELCGKKLSSQALKDIYNF